MEVPIIIKMLGAAGAPILDVIRMTRCLAEGGVVFLCGEEQKETPSIAPLIDTTPLTFFLFHFFFWVSRHLCAGPHLL